MSKDGARNRRMTIEKVQHRRGDSSPRFSALERASVSVTPAIALAWVAQLPQQRRLRLPEQAARFSSPGRVWA
jgi:hypothetical protein